MTLAPCRKHDGGICTDPEINAGEVNLNHCLNCKGYDPIWTDQPWEREDDDGYTRMV
jgi:hypothetical protein